MATGPRSRVSGLTGLAARLEFTEAKFFWFYHEFNDNLQFVNM